MDYIKPNDVVKTMLFTGLFLYWTYSPAKDTASAPAAELEPEGEPVRT